MRLERGIKSFEDGVAKFLCHREALPTSLEARRGRGFGREGDPDNGFAS